MLGFDLRNTTMVDLHWATITNTAAVRGVDTPMLPSTVVVTIGSSDDRHDCISLALSLTSLKYVVQHQTLMMPLILGIGVVSD